MHSWEVNDAMVIELDSMAITPSAAVSAMPVLTSGSSAGSTEPKNSSKMTRAATTPMSVLDDEAGLVDAATAPTTSTWRAGEFGARASCTSRVASAGEILLASLEKLTVANATRWPALTCLAPAGL
jgi:hypothetical protein